jgi:hypothetical protein
MNMKNTIAVAVAALFATGFAVTASAQTPAAAPKADAKPAATKADAKAKNKFTSPEEAAKALVEAVRAADKKAVAAVMGPGAEGWLFTGDDVSDKEEWKRFLAAYDAKNKLAKEGDAKAVLNIGADDWPFPAPIVKKGNDWVFDAAAGKEEVTNRRVGRNELDTMQALLAVVDAQREYATGDLDGNKVNDYAQRFVSTPGKKDGLYWEVKAGEKPSPLGPLVGQASAEGYGKKADSKTQNPYHGYHYRLLTAQGKDAPGGAYSYLVKDKLLGGFGVIAYPSNYGVTGVMTFIVNHDGVVYEKDLGAGTASAAGAIKAFNPDKTWKKTQP